MKLKGLTERDLRLIAYSLYEAVEDGEAENLIHQIGDKLGIDAVYGEGYDTTIARVCRHQLGWIGEAAYVSAQDRIIEALSNIDAAQGLIILIGEGEYQGAYDLCKQADSYKDAGNIILTICEQHNIEVTT